MALRLYDQELTTLLIEKQYPNVLLSKDEDIYECRTTIDHPMGRGFYQEIYFDHIHIGFGNCSLNRPILMQFESDFETVEMHFAIKGSSTADTSKFGHKVEFNKLQHNILYAHQLGGQMEWSCPELQLLEINIHPTFFQRFLPTDIPLFESFRNAIDRQASTLLAPQHNVIDLHMQQLINDILHCDRKGLFKKIYLEAKVMELLLLQMEQLSNEQENCKTISKSERDKIHAVRDFILENLDTNSSLIELAHLVGTNEFTLKKGFKQLFGTTVFGLRNDAKMEHARQLLLQQDMNISEIADLIGYKNPRHFSTAFKRKFGVIPSLLRKTR